jgi:hypothetical protein
MVNYKRILKLIREDVSQRGIAEAFKLNPLMVVVLSGSEGRSRPQDYHNERIQKAQTRSVGYPLG